MKRLLPILLIWFLCCGFTQGWQKPPLGTELNRSHPLAQRLVLACIFNEGSGKVVNNYANGNVYSGNFIWSLSPRGWSVYSNLDTGNKININPAITLSNIWSIFFICKRIGSTYTDRSIIGDSVGGTTYIGIGNDTTGILYTAAGSTNLTLPCRGDSNYFSYLVVNSTPKNSLRSWQNHTQITGSSYTTDGNFLINALLTGQNNTSYTFHGYTICMYVWANREISDYDRNNLINNPYAMFTRPIMAQPYLNFGSGGAPPAVTPKRRPTQVMIQTSSLLDNMLATLFPMAWAEK